MQSNIGKKGEMYAVFYLLSLGYEIIAKNYHTRYGEIDIIALIQDSNNKNKNLSFIEVKTRKKSNFGQPEEAFTYMKLKRFKRSIMKFLSENQILFNAWQIDFIGIDMNSFDEVVDIRHYKNVQIY
jgi:putative endonuclease